MAYPFLNMVSTEIGATGRNQGVQAFVVTLVIIDPSSGFSIGNSMPYFQPPTRNPPLGFGNSRGGIPTRGGGSPPHGSGA